MGLWMCRQPAPVTFLTGLARFPPTLPIGCLRRGFFLNNFVRLTMSYKSFSASGNAGNWSGSPNQNAPPEALEQLTAAVKRARNQVNRGKYNLRAAYRCLVCPGVQDQWVGALGEKLGNLTPRCSHHAWGSGVGAGPLVTPIKENAILTWCRTGTHFSS